jgi:Ion channel
MLTQIALGTVLMCLSIVVSAYAAWGLELFIAQNASWLVPNRRRTRFVLMMGGVSLYVLAVVTIGVWMWATTFWMVGALPSFEECLYFAMVCFTTLGLGDLVLPVEWRILSGMTAANGFLTFGIVTALMIEVLRHVRFAHTPQNRPKAPD